MLIFVLLCNTLICLINLYLFFQVLKCKKKLTQLADTLESLEKQAPFLLTFMVLNLRQAEYQALMFRQRYGNLQQKWHKILTLVQLLRWLLRKYRAWESIGNRQ